MSRIVILADLGHFRAFSLTKTDHGRTQVADLVQFDSVQARESISERVSDRRGNFPGSGSGEAHNLETEHEKRLIKEVADSIKQVLATNKHRAWDLAAPPAINARLLEELGPDLKTKLRQNLTADLSKIGKAELLRRFE
jgi:hypothetical protein